MLPDTLGEQTMDIADLRALLADKVDSLAIIIYGSPDPDAMASAMAFSYILKTWDVKSKIYTEKEISHPNNQMMVNLLDISLHPIAEAKDIKAYAIVDTQFRPCPNFPEAVCYAHIDHHKEVASSALYQHIEGSVGSTATLMTEYLKNLGAKDSKLLSKICLGLAYGIFTDTQSFLQATPRDFEALGFLKNYYESDAFNQLVNVRFSSQTMEVIKKALEHNQIKGTFAYSGIGFVSSEYRDSLAIAADFLLQQSGISNVLVYAIIEEEGPDYVNGCFRTTDSAVDVQKFMQSFVVNGTGGGRKSAGGFQEPLGFFQESKPKEKVWELVKNVVEEKIKTKITLTKVEENGKGH